MGKIKASLADVSTEIPLIDPGIYEFEIQKVEERNDGDVYLIYNVVQDAGEMQGRKLVDYINLKKNDGGQNDYALTTLKRYFEAAFGKEEVAEWGDDDFDTDELQGKSFRGQVKIDSYTPKDDPSAEPRLSNKFSRMESL